MRNNVYLSNLACLLAIGGAVAPVAAQTPAAPPAQVVAPPAAERQFTFVLSAQELAKVGAALEAMPFRDVAVLMQKMQGQFIAQQQDVAPAATPAVQVPKLPAGAPGPAPAPAMPSAKVPAK